jgi:site-specific DNA recombinase
MSTCHTPRQFEDARRGKFNVLLAEDLARLSRDQADIASLSKQLLFVGVSIVTLTIARSSIIFLSV